MESAINFRTMETRGSEPAIEQEYRVESSKLQHRE